MKVLIDDQHLLIEEFRFEFKYIIFGSKSSQDCDMIVWIPLELTTKPKHWYNQLCFELDRVLSVQLNIAKPMNSCVGHWTDRLVWTQKGSEIAESNNSIISTFGNHQQMFSECPFNTMLDRDPIVKVLRSSRYVLGKFSKMVLSRPKLDDLIYQFLTIQDIDRIDNLEQYLRQTFGGKSTNNQKRNSLVRKVYKSTLDRNLEKTQISTVLDMIDSNQVFRKLNRYVMQISRLGFTLDFIMMVDLNELSLYKDPVDRYKEISFQLGQTVALIDGVELYDKEKIAQMYPELEKYLMRRPVVGDGWCDSLNNFMKLFSSKIVGMIDDPDCWINRLTSEFDLCL